MLRPILIAVAAIGLVGALALCVVAGFVPGLGALVFWTALVLFGLIIERRRYKEILATPPGPDWTATGERFVDTASGRPVAVYFQAATGKRAYVADSGA